MPGGTTVVITFKDDTVWTFTDCTNVQALADPDRLQLTGTRNGTTGTWSFPFASIKAYVQY